MFHFTAKRIVLLCLMNISGVVVLLHGQDLLKSPVYFSSPSITRIQLLDSISDRMGINFSYNSDLITPGLPSKVSFKGESLLDVLNAILDSIHPGFVEKANHITIFPRPAPIGQVQTNSPVFHEMEGLVVDQKNSKPIPFASICLENCPLGTISNEDGRFSLRVPSELTGKNIHVSCIGYADAIQPFRSDTDNVVIFSLTPVKLKIPEAIIRPNEPVKLILNAMAAVEKNYNTRPVFLSAFFREVTWKDQICISISESVIQIYKGAYNNEYDNDQARLLKGRKKQDLEQLARLNYKVEGGLFNGLQLDIAKNPASFLQRDYMNFYIYHFDGISQYNGKEVYKISFDQKDGVPDALFKGELYLEVQSLAIVGANFALSPKGIRYARSLLIRKSPIKIQVIPVNAKYSVNYRYSGTHWNLGDVHIELDIRAKPRNAWFNSIYHTVSDLVITGLDTTEVHRFKNSEVARSTDILTNQIKNFDAIFWQGFNVLEPGNKLEDAIEKIKQKELPDLN